MLLIIATFLLIATTATALRATALPSSAKTAATCQITGNPALEPKVNQALEFRDENRISESIALMQEANDLLPQQCGWRAHLLTQLTFLNAKAGFYEKVSEYGRQALALNAKVHALTMREQADDWYLVASSHGAAGRYSEASEDYQALQTVLSHLPAAERPLSISEVYSDLAMMSLRQNRLDAAETFIEQSKAAIKESPTPDQSEEMLREDTLIHIKYARGRFTEAISDMLQLLTKYGALKDREPSFSAHLNRDYGEFCAQVGRYDESFDYLQESLKLLRVGSDTAEVATTYALLAKVEFLRRHFDSAEAMYHEASLRIGPFAKSRPVDASAIFASFGQFLAYCKRWEEAKDELVQALNLSDKIASALAFRTDTLKSLADVYHHLKDKQDEKEARREVKTLMAGMGQVRTAQTVDIATLQHDYAQK